MNHAASPVFFSEDITHTSPSIFTGIPTTSAGNSATCAMMRLSAFTPLEFHICPPRFSGNTFSARLLTATVAVTLPAVIRLDNVGNAEATAPMAEATASVSASPTA